MGCRHTCVHTCIHVSVHVWGEGVQWRMCVCGGCRCLCEHLEVWGWHRMPFSTLSSVNLKALPITKPLLSPPASASSKQKCVWITREQLCHPSMYWDPDSAPMSTSAANLSFKIPLWNTWEGGRGSQTLWAHTFNPSTQEAEAGQSLQFEVSLCNRVSGQPGLHSELLLTFLFLKEGIMGP